MRGVDHPDRCHWVRCEDGTEVLIPRCWDAVHDPAACTCNVDGSRLDRALRARDVAEQEVERLREKLQRAGVRHADFLARDARLMAEIRRLRAVVESLEPPQL